MNEKYQNKKYLSLIKDVDLDKYILNYCGGAISTTVLYVAQELLGVGRKAVYSGAWAEYVT
jgi:3-mercaptopyruvate sulfurtransferase SseA